MKSAVNFVYGSSAKVYETGAGPLAGRLRQFDYGEAFLAQRRWTFPDLVVIQFNEHWELRFYRPLAEQLLQWVSRHAGLPASSFQV